MFARSLLSARNAVKARVPRRKMGSVADYKPATMNELPVPQGSWKDSYNARQKKNNLQLVTGLLVAGGTLAFAAETDFINFGTGPKIGK